MNKINKMLLALDLLVVVICAYFAYELHDMIQLSRKPQVLYPIVLLFTISVTIAMVFYDELSVFHWFRKYGRHFCRPYLWIGDATSRFWSRWSCLGSRNSPQDSCLYRRFFFLPAFPINLSVCMTMVPSAWHSLSGIIASIIACFGSFIITGFISYTILEFVYRITAGILSDRYNQGK
jgi:hypothetical protein